MKLIFRCKVLMKEGVKQISRCTVLMKEGVKRFFFFFFSSVYGVNE